MPSIPPWILPPVKMSKLLQIFQNILYRLLPFILGFCILLASVAVVVWGVQELTQYACTDPLLFSIALGVFIGATVSIQTKKILFPNKDE